MNKGRLDFVGVGPPKTATTWVHEYLKRHKEVCLPSDPKETNFFYNKYSKGFDWYFSHFQPFDETKLVGEVCTTYFTSLQATERIYDFSPNCKIICTFRDPAERIFSYYLHAKRYGRMSPEISLREAIKQVPGMIENSKYFTHVSRWIQFFGEKNVCILLFDDLKRNPNRFAKTLCDFLALETLSIPEELQKPLNVKGLPINFTLAKICNRIGRFIQDIELYPVINAARTLGLNKIVYRSSNREEKLTQEDKIYIYNLLKDEVENLEGLLNLDLSLWKPQYISEVNK